MNMFAGPLAYLLDFLQIYLLHIEFWIWNQKENFAVSTLQIIGNTKILKQS